MVFYGILPTGNILQNISYRIVKKSFLENYRKYYIDSLLTFNSSHCHEPEYVSDMLIHINHALLKSQNDLTLIMSL